MGWRTVATQPGSFRFSIPVTPTVAVRVFTSDELIEDDDYAPGVMNDLTAAWDADDHFTVDLLNTADGTHLNSISGMAGYGGPEAAACAAFFDHWASEFSDAERAEFARIAGCDARELQRHQRNPEHGNDTDDSQGYDIDLNGLQGLGVTGVSPTGDDVDSYDLSEFKRAFIDELLYAGTDPNGRSWNRNYSLDHIAQASLDAILRECESFSNTWRDTIEAGRGFEAAGQDFLLTRNRAPGLFGFGDEDWAESRDALTAAAEAYPPLTLYVGGDGFLYVEGYERGAKFDFSRGMNAVSVLLPDGSWAGPFANEALADAAYWEAVNAGAARAVVARGGPAPADGGGYDIDLNGLRGLGAAAREHADVFTRAFGETLLQLSQELREAGYTFDNLATPTWNAIVAECRMFQAMFGAQLGDLATAGAAFALQRSGDSYRGFWNGQWPEPLATELVVGSNAYPRIWLYLGDDGQVYGDGYELGARHFVEAGLHTVPAEERSRTNGLGGLGAPVVLATRPRTLRLTYKLVSGHHAAAIRVFDSEDLIEEKDYTPRTQAAMKATWDAGDHYDVELYDPVTGELFEVLYNQAGYGSPAAAACAVMSLHWAPHEFEDSELGEMIEGGFVWPDGVLEKFYADMGCCIGSDCPQGVPEEYRDYNLNGLQGLGASSGPSDSDIGEFSSGFFEALLWSSQDDDGNNLDAIHEVGDIDKPARDALERECAAFARRWHAEIARGEGYERAGHDFLLTRNHHGAGFWDGDWPIDGDVLTPGAHDYPEIDLYVGDDGKLYASGYELGAHFNYNGPRAVEVMLPDATYIGPFGSAELAYEAYRNAAVVDDVGWKPGTFAPPPDNSPGYKIDLDGLRGLRGPGGPTDAELAEFKASFFDNALEFTVDPVNGMPLGESYTVDDIAQPARDALVRECEAFARRWSTEIERGEGYEQAGHCFFMTRNIVEEYTFADLWVSDVATDAWQLNAAAMGYPIVDLQLGDPRFIGEISVDGYERGAFIGHYFTRPVDECKALLPDGSWLGPYQSEDDALAAYWAAVGGTATAIRAPRRRSPPPDDGGGYDMDLDGLRGRWRGDLAEAQAARLYTKCFMLFDDGGRTADRYTLIARKPLTPPSTGAWRPLFVYAGFDENPSSPQGIGTTGELTEAMFDSHEREGFVAFGQLVDLDVLPPRALQFANDFMDSWRDDLEDWDAQDWYGCDDDSPSDDYDDDAESDSAPPGGGAGYDIDLDGTRRRVRRSEL